MIGQGAGARGTQKVNNWTQHLTYILDAPDSDVPIANVDLLWAALPEYHTGKATAETAKLADGAKEQVDDAAEDEQVKLSTSKVTAAASGAERRRADPDNFTLSHVRILSLSLSSAYVLDALLAQRVLAKRGCECKRCGRAGAGSIRPLVPRARLDVPLATGFS